MLRSAIALLTVGFMAGCSASVGENHAATANVDESALTFSYKGIADPGFMDQTLTIDNSAGTPVVLTAHLTARDAEGNPLPEVDVRTLYGSDEGRLVVLPGENVDVLAF